MDQGTVLWPAFLDAERTQHGPGDGSLAHFSRCIIDQGTVPCPLFSMQSGLKNRPLRLSENLFLQTGEPVFMRLHPNGKQVFGQSAMVH